jgi:hypothetical protein
VAEVGAEGLPAWEIDSGGWRGGADSGKVGARGGPQATLGGSTGPRDCARGAGCEGTAGGGSALAAAMARRAVGNGGEDAAGQEKNGGLL